MFGYVKGYDIFTVSKRKTEKEQLMGEMESICPTIKEDIEKAIDSGGRVYGVKKNNMLKAVYLFEGVSKGNRPELKFQSSYYTGDAEDKADDFEKFIMSQIKELVDIGMYVKAQWNDDIITLDPLSEGGFSAPIFCIAMIIGALFGIACNSIIVGLCLGCGMGLCFGTVFRKRK